MIKHNTPHLFFWGALSLLYLYEFINNILLILFKSLNLLQTIVISYDMSHGIGCGIL